MILVLVLVFDACDQYKSRLFDWQLATDFPDFATCLPPTLVPQPHVRESERERVGERERERANVIAMRPKLTKRKPQQKQTMRTALKFFKKFHVSCRSFSFSLSMHFPLLRNSTTPWWGACYGLLCLFLLGDARRRDDYRKVFEAKLFLSFFYSFFFFLRLPGSFWRTGEPFKLCYGTELLESLAVEQAKSGAKKN